MRRTPLENWIVNKIGLKEGSRKAIEEYQLLKVREAIAFAQRNSAFYGRLLKNVDATGLLTLEDINRLPFTYPEDVSENPFSFLCVPQGVVERIVSLNTSGTSGNGKRIFFTKEDLDYTIDFFKHGMSCLLDATDRVLVLLPGKAYGSIGDLLKEALLLSGIECTVLGVLTDLEEAAKCIAEKQATTVVGIPIQVLYLSRMKGDIFKRYIRKALLSTDYVPEVIIKELTEEQGCSVYTHYGMTEMGYGGGVECDALNGYHLREGDLYFEVIDTETGAALEEGKIGEVVFTTLTRQGMPLIRYRTGDMASFSREACSCGTLLKTMKRVQGRIDNRVKLKDGQFIHLRELDEILYSFKNIMSFRAAIQAEDELMIDCFIQEELAFNQLKGEVEQRLNGFLEEKLGYRLKLEVKLNQSDMPTKMTNSIAKRIIHDLRRM